MNVIPTVRSLILNSTVLLLLFWVAVFILNAGPHWEKYSSTRELIETAGMITVLQMLVALVALKWLVPNFLERQRWFAFWSLLFVTLLIASEVNIAIRVFYLEPVYPSTYRRFLELYGHMSAYERLSLTWSMRYIIFSKLPLFLFPAAILIAHNFYRKQQLLLSLREQRKSAELDALKNQLNPHFIFNTLNNIYSLALQKSDRTPLAIEQLSAILDYVVYRCNELYVPLSSEIELVQNYVALEKIRYGDRLAVTFKINANTDLRIAPMIMLTLLENACKHSTRDELETANIAIEITEEEDSLQLKISNSKPPGISRAEPSQDQVGLANLRKQLDLLYPDAHRFSVTDTSNSYIAEITLEHP